jgi:hypothetical protein
MTPRSRAALHEAGHAVIGSSLGWLVEEIVVTETERGIEAHTVAGPPPGAGLPDAMDRLLYACGGIVAEAIQFGTDPRDAVRQSIVQGARDGHEMLACLEILRPKSKRPVILTDAADLVADRLRSLWSEVQAIAAAAEEHGVCHLRPTS